MNKTFALLSLLLFATLPIMASANDEGKEWSIEANIGGATIFQDDDYWNVSNNQSNVISLGGEYYLNRHVALDGGLFAEQRGLFTDFSESIGLLTHWSAGVYAGAKWYPLNQKYIIQPYAAANVYLNALNLTSQKGEKHLSVSNGFEGQGILNYEIQHPIMSVGPKLGVDIRMIGSLSLTLAYELRYDLYGKANGKLTMTSGNQTGTIYQIRDERLSSIFSIGLKLDFPTRRVSETSRSNLLLLLFGLLSGR